MIHMHKIGAISSLISWLTDRTCFTRFASYVLHKSFHLNCSGFVCSVPFQYASYFVHQVFTYVNINQKENFLHNLRTSGLNGFFKRLTFGTSILI